MDIDDDVLQQGVSLGRTLPGRADVLKSPLTLPLRSGEDIFPKGRLIMKIGGHFGPGLHKRGLDAPIERVGVLPKVEEQAKFIRGVIPGDPRRKLKPETIEILDRKLKNSLRTFDYC